MPAFAPRRRSPAARLLALALSLPLAAQGGPLLDRLIERRAERQAAAERQDAAPAAALPAGARLLRDLPYGSDPRQRMDVYLPARAQGAPVIFMVHGGAWRTGDKGAAAVVDHKVARWLARGVAFISVDYRLLPQAGPLQQAQDVARALATAQAHAAEWGADPARFVLMGHSAGAHLVALLAAAPEMPRAAGARPWLGSVALDSAAFDVPQIMASRHLPLYDRAFGQDPAYWRQASPFHALQRASAPLLAVCSTRRADACPQAQRFAARQTALGGRAQVLEEDLSHREINADLGRDGAYTASVERFLAGLDATLGERLAAPR